MLVFYYQYRRIVPQYGIDVTDTHIVCVGPLYPTRGSLIWRNCNTSVFMVPGTMTGDEVDDAELPSVRGTDNADT